MQPATRSHTPIERLMHRLTQAYTISSVAQSERASPPIICSAHSATLRVLCADCLQLLQPALSQTLLKPELSRQCDHQAVPEEHHHLSSARHSLPQAHHFIAHTASNLNPFPRHHPPEGQDIQLASILMSILCGPSHSSICGRADCMSFLLDDAIDGILSSVAARITCLKVCHLPLTSSAIVTPCNPAKLFASIAPPDPGPLRSCNILNTLASLSMLCAAAAQMAAALPCPMSRSNDGELGSSRSCIEMMFCCL